MKDTSASSGILRPEAFGKPDVFCLVALMGLTWLCFALIGFEQGLSRDTAIYLYSSKQLTQGILPYVSIFDHKGPLTSFLGALAITLSKPMALPEWLATRLFFAALSSLSICLIYVIGRHLSLTRIWAVLAALLLLGFSTYIFHAVAGPRPKIAFVFFECLAVLSLLRKSWFGFGAAVACCTLIWQPGFCLVLAALGVMPKTQKLRAIARIVLGGTIVLLPIVLIYASVGQFKAFIDSFVLFNFTDLHRPKDQNVLANLRTIMRHTVKAFGPAGLVFLLGSGFAFTLLFRQVAGLRVLGVIAVLFVGLNVIDIQSSVDLLPALSPAVLGFALLCQTGARAWSLKRQVIMASCLALLLLAWLPIELDLRAKTLRDQERRAQALAAICDRPGCLYFLGDTVPLALSDIRNPSRYGFVITGIGAFIARKEGGLEVWLEALTAEYIVLGRMNGPGTPEIQDWLAQNFVQVSHIDKSLWQRQ